MILYHAITMYQILECITHKLLNYHDEKCVLILPDFIVEKFPKYRRLQTTGLFYRVYLFPYMKIGHDENNLYERLNEEYEQSVGISLFEFSEIYVAGVHFYFSILLAQKKIYFKAFEEAARGVFLCQKLERNIALKFPVHAQIAKKYGMLMYNSQYIEEIFVYEINHNLGKKQKKFVIQEELSKLSSKQICKILYVFNERKRVLFSNPIIVLTEQFYNLGYMNEDDQKVLYLKVFEYINTYMKEHKIFVKPHPDDKILYKKIKSVTRVLSSLMPAELLPYVLPGKKLKFLTVSSTAVLGLQGKASTEVLISNPKFQTMIASNKSFSKLLN